MTGGVDEIPDDSPVVERDAVRLVVHDVLGRILLFWARESTMPELGYWWELPGGGIDAGETYVEAAVRELREETGIAISPEQVGPPTWRRSATFRHRRTRRLQHEVVVAVRLGSPARTSTAASGWPTRWRTTSTSGGVPWRRSSPARSASTRAGSRASCLRSWPASPSTSPSSTGRKRLCR